MLVWETCSPMITLQSKLQFIWVYMSFFQRAIHTLSYSLKLQQHKGCPWISLFSFPLHGPYTDVWASQRISVGWTVQGTRRKQWRLGPWGQPPAASSTRCAGTFYDLPTFLLSSCPGLDHPALSEPAFIKMLWLEPLKACRRIFMPNLLGFFFKMSTIQRIFWLFLCCIRRNQFPL